jgi:hypothetical protein
LGNRGEAREALGAFGDLQLEISDFRGRSVEGSCDLKLEITDFKTEFRKGNG